MAQKYNIFIDELEDNDYYWKTILRLITGLGEGTMLGNLITIRAEEDQEIIKKFSKEEKRIWLEWQKNIPIEYKRQKLSNMAKNL